MLRGARTLTANIVMEMSYAPGRPDSLHRDALIGSGVVLLLFVLMINMAFVFLVKRKGV
jgi:phosphate transport system permease protein